MKSAQQRRLAHIEPVAPRIKARAQLLGAYPPAGVELTSSIDERRLRHTTCTGSASPSHTTPVRRMSWRSITACSARKCLQPRPAVEADQARSRYGSPSRAIR